MLPIWRKVISKVGELLEMIKFEHSIFALPFALMSTLLATNGKPALWPVFWVIVAMVAARSAAMALNRLIDARIDALNPRTRERAIPAGRIKPREAWILVFLSFGILFLAVLQLPPLCFQLLPIAIFVLIIYSFVKRISLLSHLVLGLALGIGAVGGWIALRGTLDMPAILLGVAVILWVAGFDIIYACQDMEFDRSQGLHSIPAKLGIHGGLWISSLLHLFAALLLLSIGIILHLGPFYYAGTAIVSLILFYEQYLIRKEGLGKVDVAFFNANGWISMTMFGATALNYWVIL